MQDSTMDSSPLTHLKRMFLPKGENKVSCVMQLIKTPRIVTGSVSLCKSFKYANNSLCLVYVNWPTCLRVPLQQLKASSVFSSHCYATVPPCQSCALGLKYPKSSLLHAHAVLTVYNNILCMWCCLSFLCKDLLGSMTAPFTNIKHSYIAEEMW